MSRRRIVLAFVCSSSFLFAACGGSQPSAEAPPAVEATPSTAAPADSSAPASDAAAPAAAAPKTVEVAVQSRSSSKVTGKATLTETADGVKIVLALEGLTPGDHGAHVHEKGDCSAPDATSAGGHFNPAGHPHALPAGSPPRHLGDLGNVTAGKDGKATLEVVATGANLKDSDPNSFLGRSIIVHEKKDDGGQPTGNAGGRVACAEIK